MNDHELDGATDPVPDAAPHLMGAGDARHRAGVRRRAFQRSRVFPNTVHDFVPVSVP
ncbi:hypothetical protein HNR16_001636 [Pseudoclavibacter chungangensis]|uniref:hypothetical protein n=1 Tax=Pseudoclavibacter chungangensis TaxID=587635 RepID=UPI0015CAF81E|nr:hypothetical protein [Pseudoclavibacter chungangensis]NYJ66848.1 hypothetical protein [Pseudoclavibacter chungangensis]